MLPNFLCKKGSSALSLSLARFQSSETLTLIDNFCRNWNPRPNPNPQIDQYDSNSMGRDSVKSLAPGFRFHPTDEELVRYYLKRKVSGKPFRLDPISVVDIYKSEPWDLPSKTSHFLHFNTCVYI